MIIDSHVHLGTMLGFDMTEADIIVSLEKYGIAKALVSNVESTEFDREWKPIPAEDMIGELESNRRTLELVRRNPGILYGQYWFKPATERLGPEAEALIRENRGAFRGLKMHPYHSMTSIADQRCEPWLELVAELKLPVAVHTAGDRFSDPENVYTAAKAHTGVDFIMVHLGLGTDNRKAIELVSSLPNLYGDTTWVSKEHALDAIRSCGADKILFGTDSPIDGVDTYAKYTGLLDFLRAKLSAEEFELVTRGNAVRLFGI